MNKDQRRQNQNIGGRKANNSSGASAQSMLEEGFTNHQEGRLQQAEELYRQALQVDPNNPDALNLLAIIADTTGRNDEAIGLMEKAVAASPENPDLLNNLGQLYKKSERLDDAIEVYKTAIAADPNYADAHNNLGNVLTMIGRFEEAIGYFRNALEIDPNNARTHYNLATTLFEQKNFPDAIEAFRRVITIDANYADAYNNLGSALIKLGKLEEGVTSFRQALALKPLDAEAHYNLGNAFKDQGKLEEAVASYHKALAIRPDYAEAHSNLGLTFKDQGKLEEAVASYHKALAINPDFAEAHSNLGIVQLLMGDFRNGWENYNFRWTCDDSAIGKIKYVKKLWQGQPIDGRRLLVWGEQGIGEEILFASLIPGLIELGADIILECEKRLIPLFSRSFPTITCANMDDPDTGNAEQTQFDLHTPLGNVARWLHPDFTSFSSRPPYLVADSQQRQTLRKRYLDRGNDVLVGVAWYSKSPSLGPQKSMALQDLGPLLEVPGITFIDLQYGDTSEERQAFTAETGVEVFHDDGIDQMADLDSFTSQVAAMDMVVTISNSTAHVAGALGIPTLLLLGSYPLWYWLLERDDSPWYPTVQLFRQARPGEWGDVIDRVAERLVNL